MMSGQFSIQTVAVIGAGPSGLTAAKSLLGQKAFREIVVFEQQPEVGGVWNHSDLTSPLENIPQVDPMRLPDPSVASKEGQAPVFPNPMYDDLNTNIPHTLMNFRGYPFPKGSLIFPPHAAVQDYLVEYARSVRHLVRLCSRVVNVRLLPAKADNNNKNRQSDRWEVTWEETTTHIKSSAIYDAVVVASGHYSLPFVPAIKNITEFNTKFPGLISHSKSYRNIDSFRGKRTIVVGNGASGLDIARQISTVCQKPLLISVKTPTTPAYLAHAGGEEVPEIVEFGLGDTPSVILSNGHEEKVDAILFCTGFFYSYPFLDNGMFQPPLIASGRRVQGLYEQLFHIQHPSLVFAGLLVKAVPFPVAEAQAAVFARVWANCLDLPHRLDMEKWEQDQVERKGDGLHVCEKGRDIDYINRMHTWAMQSPESGVTPPLWEKYEKWQRHTYKDAKQAFEEQGKTAKSLDELGYVYSAEAPLPAIKD